jgi:hypothetical protein
MGGKLNNTKRISKDKYQKIKHEIIANFLIPLGQYEECSFSIPLSLHDKEDYGDMDILFNHIEGWGKARNVLKKYFEDYQYKLSNGMMSFIYDDFSVDFIQTKLVNLDIATKFMQFNCLGNMIGRLCKRLDLKFGDTGLYFVYRRENDNHYKKDLFLTNDYDTILRFFGLNGDMLHSKLTSIELYEFITSSPYFSAYPYLNLNGNLQRRVNKERKPIIDFIEWLKIKGENIERKKIHPSKQENIDRVETFFPKIGLSNWIAIEDNLHREDLLVKEKFNGRIVSEITGLKGKELGKFIGELRKNRQSFNEFIIISTKNEVEKWIKIMSQSKKNIIVNDNSLTNK